jgi:hypothetical protein
MTVVWSCGEWVAAVAVGALPNWFLIALILIDHGWTNMGELYYHNKHTFGWM